MSKYLLHGKLTAKYGQPSKGQEIEVLGGAGI